MHDDRHLLLLQKGVIVFGRALLKVLDLRVGVLDTRRLHDGHEGSSLRVLDVAHQSQRFRLGPESWSPA